MQGLEGALARIAALEGELAAYKRGLPERPTSGRLRRRAAAVGVVAGAVATLVVASAFAPRAAAPQELVLRDDSGRKRVWLGVLANGGAGLGFFDEQGKSRIELAMGPSGSSDLLFLDGGGLTRAHLGLANDGAPRLQLADPSGAPAVGLEVAPDGARRLRLARVDDGRAVELRILDDGRPGLEVRGPDGVGRISLGLDSAHGARIELRDPASRVSFARP